MTLVLFILYTFAISNSCGSIFLIPSITFVHIIGKDIRKLANMGTLFALNHINAISIIVITGVDRIITRKGSKILLNTLLKPAAKPTSSPRTNDSAKPMRPLSREKRIIIKKSRVFMRLKRLTSVISGGGIMIAEFTITDIIFHIASSKAKDNTV